MEIINRIKILIHYEYLKTILLTRILPHLKKYMYLYIALVVLIVLGLGEILICNKYSYTKKQAEILTKEEPKTVEIQTTPSVTLYNFYTLTGNIITGEFVGETKTEYITKVNQKDIKYLKTDIFRYEKK